MATPSLTIEHMVGSFLVDAIAIGYSLCLTSRLLYNEEYFFQITDCVKSFRIVSIRLKHKIFLTNSHSLTQNSHFFIILDKVNNKNVRGYL